MFSVFFFLFFSFSFSSFFSSFSFVTILFLFLHYFDLTIFIFIFISSFFVFVFFSPLSFFIDCVFFCFVVVSFSPLILFRVLVRWPISSTTPPTLLLKRYIYAAYDTLRAPQQHARLITNPSERPFAFSQLTIDNHTSMIKHQPQFPMSPSCFLFFFLSLIAVVSLSLSLFSLFLSLSPHSKILLFNSLLM